MKKTNVLFLLLGVLLSSLSAQVTQPKIMVIPYTKEGEDIRTVLEKDHNKRIVLTVIKEAFDSKGVSTIDFVAKLKAMESGNVFMDNRTDIKSQIIDMSGADIYVEAEIICLQQRVSGQAKPESRVKIILTAYESSTGSSLANKVGESGTFYTDDIGALAMRAISICADDFLRVMQTKFTDMASAGRSVMLQIGFDENSNLTMESPIGDDGLTLGDIIELWVSDNSNNGDYHLQGVSPSKIVFDDIKLPLVDANGNNFNASKYSMELLKFFRKHNIAISRSIRENTIYITIQ